VQAEKDARRPVFSALIFAMLVTSCHSATIDHTNVVNNAR
jgi:hypothetical protein